MPLSPLARLFLAPALALAPLIALAPAAGAQDLSPIAIEAHSFEQLTDWTQSSMRPCCTPEVIETEGQRLLEIRAQIDVPWSDALSRLSVPAKEIRAVLPDGTELQPIGRFEYEGMFSLRAPSISVSRPRNWPTEDADAFVAPIFLIPRDAAQVTLRITDMADVAVPVPPPSSPPEAADFAEFKVLRAAALDRLDLTNKSGGQTVTSRIEPAPGFIFVELELAVTGTRTNRYDGGDRFNWYTHNFTLVDPQGRNAGLIGERFMDRILGWQFSGVKVGDTATRKVIWTVPADQAEAVLHFGDRPIYHVRADGTATPIAPPEPAAAAPAAPAEAAATGKSLKGKSGKPVAAATPAATPAAAAPAPCGKGTAIEVQWQNKWWASTIKDGPDGQGRCLIGYDGWDATWDEWVGADRMRPR